MINRRPIIDNSTPAFLGILEGKKRTREAEARVKEEEAKRATLLLQLEAARQGYDPERTRAQQAIQLETTKQGSEKTLYMVLGGIVIAVMIGIYFIKKK